jgi:hypothetical protein
MGDIPKHSDFRGYLNLHELSHRVALDVCLKVRHPFFNIL